MSQTSLSLFFTKLCDISRESERERESGAFCTLSQLSVSSAFDWRSEAIRVIEFHQNQSHRDLFMKVLFCSIHWEQYDGQVHLCRKKVETFQKFCFPDLKFGRELSKVWGIWFRRSCVAAKSQSCVIEQTERGFRFPFRNTWQHY